jgi:hypothetical protein
MCYAGAMNKLDPTQSEKFNEAARMLECGDDEARFDERVKKLAKLPLVKDGQAFKRKGG